MEGNLLLIERKFAKYVIGRVTALANRRFKNGAESRNRNRVGGRDV
jgi:hypothetical protein